MKVVGIIFGIVGIVFVLLLLGTVSGNRDLATPGPSLVVGLLPANWRLLVGPFCLFAAIFLTAGWIAVRKLPGYSWLALLVFFILGVPYLVLPGLLTNAVTLMIVALILVIGVPIVTAAIASAIGRAARKRAAAQ